MKVFLPTFINKPLAPSACPDATSLQRAAFRISLNLLEKKQSETPGFAVLKVSKTGLVGKLFAAFCYVV
jgi:hypothetical protein